MPDKENENNHLTSFFEQLKKQSNEVGNLQPTQYQSSISEFSQKLEDLEPTQRLEDFLNSLT